MITPNADLEQARAAAQGRVWARRVALPIDEGRLSGRLLSHYFDGRVHIRPYLKG